MQFNLKKKALLFKGCVFSMRYVMKYIVTVYCHFLASYVYKCMESSFWGWGEFSSSQTYNMGGNRCLDVGLWSLHWHMKPADREEVRHTFAATWSQLVQPDNFLGALVLIWQPGHDSFYVCRHPFWFYFFIRIFYFWNVGL